VQVNRRTNQVEIVNRMLRQEIETKNEFIRTVTHDLNAPLRNIAGMIRMIRKRHGGALPEDVARRIDRIEANVDLETSMLDDLLELSRLRTRPYKTSDIDLNELFHQIRETFESELSERGISFEIEGTFPIVHLEPRLVRQVFLNLVDNAVKYIADGPERRIRIYREADPNWLAIGVADTGPGIPEEARERIFGLFCRGVAGPEGSAPTAPGRGVGLASVRTVVERWGGSIDLHYVIDRGSRFIVRIPVNRIVSAGCAGASDSDSPARAAG